MNRMDYSISRRIVTLTVLVFGIIVTYLAYRLVTIQITNHKYLQQSALLQWTNNKPIEPVRGTIYDKNGRKLAISVKKNTAWVRPQVIESEIENNKKIVKNRRNRRENEDIKLYTSTEDMAKKIARIIDMDSKEVDRLLNGKETFVRIKQGIDQTNAEKLRNLKIDGLDVIEENERFYPKGRLASYIIGHTSDEQIGQYGIESYMNNYLAGVEGKFITVSDGRGRQLPDTDTRQYAAVDGDNVYLTIDARIQEIVENAISLGEINTGAKRVSAIVMDPMTGDILAMESTPGYDLNNPREIESEDIKKKWNDLKDEDKEKEYYKIWRNYNVSDSYDPGSTFKPLVVAAALEENVIDEKYTFTCDGFLTDIKSDTPIRCWKWYDPHGLQTLEEGLANSCNDMMGDIGLKLGGKNLYKYMKKLGYGEATGINITGEGIGIIPRAEDIKEATLANISFGQGLSATPIQHITALSTIANGGNLLKPNLIKAVKSPDGKIIEEAKPVIKRKVFSKEKSKEVLNMLGFTASEQYVNFLSVPGYNIAAKTGTSQKIVNNRYSNERYVGSFVGIAPIEDPKFIVLVIIDEPSRGQYYGSEVAGPVGETIINETLRYMNIKPTKDINDNDNLIIVPDVRELNLKEAMSTLRKAGLDYSTDAYYMTPEDIVESQSPLPGEQLPFGSFIDLKLKQEYDPKEQKVPTEEEMLEEERKEAEERRQILDKEHKKEFEDEEDKEEDEEDKKEEKSLKVPVLTGKPYEEVLKEINKLGVRLVINGESKNGIVKTQSPKAGTKIKPDTVIEISIEE
ncbi:MAG: penicillin-binding transpeptidase domain-containing protein [Andreesenia angusta]|nr:penicillin-binding transpeptidase domain-containing protein [Andreesenia angusta]